MADNFSETAHDLDHVGDMYSQWFRDYASYVILDRAVPALEDGMKPVQRRILHSMREMEDGRYNKVANIVGNTMKYHPHGDASIAAALVAMGQRRLLIDTQGNWGNILTGDGAAAPRYIEARLTKFALEVVFNPKTTTWALSYDGRNQEPVTLPAKFPLVLAHGVEGIAVGLSTRILPHNFNELIDASIAALRNQKYDLFPDFPTGGIADCSNYNDGKRGGRVRIRARIEAVKKTLLRISEIPYGTNTQSLIDSIVAANEKKKIKISKVDDNTASDVEILVHLPPGTEPQEAIDALYAFTDCEVSIAPNACVITEGRPQFLSVAEILERCAIQTKELLRRELEIRLGELQEKWHFSSLEKIFIEKRIYRQIEDKETWEDVVNTVDKGMQPYAHLFHREITRDDLLRLLEIRIKRISRYDAFKADEQIKALEDEIAEVEKNLRNLTRYAIRYFEGIKKKYGGEHPRLTELAAFERVQAAKVAVANEKLYVSGDGFVGYGLKREQNVQEVCACSTMDDVLSILKDGTLQVSRVSEKQFVGKPIEHVALYDKEAPTVYNLIYRDGRDGKNLIKRFTIGGVTRDRAYDLTAGKKGSRILYFSANKDENDAPKVRIHLDDSSRARTKSFDIDFAEHPVRTRGAKGTIVTHHKIDRIVRAPKE